MDEYESVRRRVRPLQGQGIPTRPIALSNRQELLTTTLKQFQLLTTLSTLFHLRRRVLQLNPNYLPAD